MATTRVQRSVALTAAAYQTSKAAAEAADVSQAAWVAEAIEQRGRREDAQAYAEYMRQPEMAEQLADWRALAPAWPGERSAAAA